MIIAVIVLAILSGRLLMLWHSEKDCRKRIEEFSRASWNEAEEAFDKGYKQGFASGHAKAIDEMKEDLTNFLDCYSVDK